MPVHIFPTLELSPYCVINGFPIYKYATYVYCRKKRQLHLIRPHYHPCLPTDIQEQLKITPIVTVNGTLCPSITVTHPQNCQHSFIWTVIIPEVVVLDNTVSVAVDGIEFVAHAIDTYMNETIQDVTTSTLFKHDYKNTRLYIDYYYNYHSIKSYLLYYNGSIESIHEYISTLSTHADCNIVFFGFNFPYWQTFCGKNDYTTYWSHSAQSIQQTHSAIIADSWSNSLMNIDYDEYLDPAIDFRSLLKRYNALNFHYKSSCDTCNGALCLCDYDYEYTDILKHVRIGEKIGYLNCKFIENTLNKKIYNRNVHHSFLSNPSIRLEKAIYHIKCLSYDHADSPKKRYCVTPPSSL